MGDPMGAHTHCRLLELTLCRPPGLGVIQVEQAGMTGTLQARFAISHLDGTGVERADPHGLAVRYRYLSIVRSGNGVAISWPISASGFFSRVSNES